MSGDALVRTHRSGRKTTRAIRAVRISAEDKDEASFHLVGGSLTQARSRAPFGRKHEHCNANMLARPHAIKCGTFPAAPAGVREGGISRRSDMNNKQYFRISLARFDGFYLRFIFDLDCKIKNQHQVCGRIFCIFAVAIAAASFKEESR